MHIQLLTSITLLVKPVGIYMYNMHKRTSVWRATLAHYQSRQSSFNFSPLMRTPVDELLLMSYTPTVCIARNKERKKKKNKKRNRKEKKNYRKNLLLFIDRSFIAPVRSHTSRHYSRHGGDFTRPRCTRR